MAFSYMYIYIAYLRRLKNLITSFSSACKEFGLTITIKKTEVMGQNTTNPPVITIGEKVLEEADKCI